MPHTTHPYMDHFEDAFEREMQRVQPTITNPTFAPVALDAFAKTKSSGYGHNDIGFFVTVIDAGGIADTVIMSMYGRAKTCVLARMDKIEQTNNNNPNTVGESLVAHIAAVQRDLQGNEEATFFITCETNLRCLFQEVERYVHKVNPNHKSFHYQFIGEHATQSMLAAMVQSADYRLRHGLVRFDTTIKEDDPLRARLILDLRQCVRTLRYTRSSQQPHVTYKMGGGGGGIAFCFLLGVFVTMTGPGLQD